MDTLTATLSNGRITFSRRVFLGATYTLAFAGDAASLSGLTLYVTDREGKIAYSTSVTADGSATLALTAQEMIDLFEACGGESIGFSSWLKNATGTIGYGQLNVLWSPLVTDIETGTAASMKGDAGVGIASISKSGTVVTFTLTDASTRTVDVSDLKGDKGATGSVVGSAAATIINALPTGEPADGDAVFAQIASIKSALKALAQQ